MPLCKLCGKIEDATNRGQARSVPSDYFLEGWSFYDTSGMLHSTYDSSIVYMREETLDTVGRQWRPYIGVCPKCCNSKDNLIIRG